jgi:5-methylcytosine-specific restriction endonuclease McrA
MRTSVPDGDLGKIIEAAVTEKLERLESKRFAKPKAPRKGLKESKIAPSSRHIPAAVRRAVHARDKGQCTFVDPLGRRCRARKGLEFHHQRPFGRGGDHSPRNVRLMCKTHNTLLAERDYGKETMARHSRAPTRVCEALSVRGMGGVTARAP